MRSSTLVKRFTCVLAIITALSACAPSSQLLGNYDIQTEISELEYIDRLYPTTLYVRNGAPEFHSYDSFIIAPVKVAKNDGISDEDRTRIASYFEQSLKNSLSAAGYKTVNSASSSTLKLEFYLSGLSAPVALPNVVSLAAPIAISVGEITIEAAFINSSTDRVDAVVVEKTRGSRMFNPSPWSTWADIEQALDNFAADFSASLKL